ncbi:MAG: succinate dehydrogenase iron-sulfur subunit [Deltaproteobacteria bacterium]|nr:succinate dehydrogenase iron-sulfur subunit [Deltaproteobacteria bacterium]
MADQKEQETSVFTEEVIKEVIFRVHRFSPDDGKPPRMQDYKVPVKRGMTVLDGLHYIRDNLDSTLSYRFSCRMAICGSCGMFINNLPRLACKTQILELEADTIEVKPLPNYEVIKDLVPDLSDFFEKHRSVMPYLIREEEEEKIDPPTNEFLQTPDELERFLQFAYCTKCGLCLAGCPTVATDKVFLGPMALAQAFRYNSDTRDQGFEKRLELLCVPEGPWRCHFAGSCSEVCPKGVDPALGVQLLKGQIVFTKLGLKKPHKIAPLATEKPEAKRRPGIPEAPPRTVKKE